MQTKNLYDNDYQILYEAFFLVMLEVEALQEVELIILLEQKLHYQRYLQQYF